MPGLPDTPPGLETLANADLAAVAALIDAVQPSVLAADGRYWQGLPTHAAPPTDGIASAPDRLGVRPSDRSQTWSDLGIAPGSRRVSVRCDEYVGASGAGYSVTATISIGGSEWERTISGAVDPENRAHDWREVVDAI